MANKKNQTPDDGPEPERGDQQDAEAAASRHDLSHEELVDVGPVEDEEQDDLDGLLSDEDLDVLSGQLTAEELAAERLADLQRVTAEYANYRKRTEANRDAERERAVSDTVKGL